MAIFPVRNLGGVGVVTDVNPYDLPNEAFSRADNVMFDEGRVQRAPVFKSLYDPVSDEVTYDSVQGSYSSNGGTFNSAAGSSVYDIRFIGSYQDPDEGKIVFTADKLGKIRSYPDGVLTEQTPSGTLVNNEEPWTHTQVAGISMLARKSMIPYARNINSDSNYKMMSSPAGSTWNQYDTCAVIRSYNDFAIALNVTKGAVEYPTMVKWSDIIPYGAAVANIDWNSADTTNSAGENVLGEVKSALLDGLSLGSQFIIYAEDQVWMMEYTGSSLVFNFRRLFNSGGIINSNCVVEVEGKHFVFGKNDIYFHDGVNMKSIADSRIRREVYESMDKNQIKKFFVQHDSQENLLYFSYVSKSSDIGFPNTIFANRAALYNYRTDTWSFMDLPNVVGGTDAQVNTNRYLYRDLPYEYDRYNTSYSAFSQNSVRCNVMLSIVDDANSLTETRMFAVDLSTQGVLSLPANIEAYRPAFVERVGIDMAEPDGGIRDYKLLSGITPQIKYTDSGNYVKFDFGGSDRPNQPTIWHTSYDYYPDNDYKISSKAYGRYLAYRATFPGLSGFKFSGLDADIRHLSAR